ncbi:MAG: FtsX-like permease family protein [bacterium]
MKFGQVFSLNIKKLNKRKAKASWLIIPIAALVMLSLLVSSQIKNIRTAVDESVFGTVDEQNTLIKLSNNPFTQIGRGQGFGAFNMEQQNYSEADIANISEIANVSQAALAVELPVNQITAGGLFAGTGINVPFVIGLDSEFANLYTDQNFAYIPGQPVPIILNSQTFTRLTENWDGQTEITIDFDPGDFQRGGDRQVRGRMSSGPIQSEIIDYQKDQLIGKEITLSFGGLADLPTYTIEPNIGGMKFIKYSDEEIEASASSRREAIESYWNYQAISEPLIYDFQVVGVIEDQGVLNTYLPTEFVATAMSDLTEHQLAARTETEIPSDELNNTFTGLLFDGTELTTQDESFVGRIRGAAGAVAPGARIDFGQESDSQTSYEIPGLIIETERVSDEDNSVSTGDVIGLYTSADAYNLAAQTSDTVYIKVDSIFNRSQVIDDLNAAGYTYQDLSDLDVFDELQSTLQWVSNITIIAFIFLSVIIIIFTMTKFVSESKKEIGIYRALGMTKGGIKALFSVQGLLYTVIGYLVGGVLGLLIMPLLASPIYNWFDGFLEKTVQESFNVVNTVDVVLFRTVDWSTFGIYSGVLIVIAVITALIPSNHAANIDPVDAIRNE